MRSMQVRATELQDATAQLEVMRARSRELRLRASDLQAREQQLRELRYPTPAGPERAQIDKQWLAVRHDLTAVQLEIEGLNERISEVRVQRDQARSLALQPPPAPDIPPAQADGLARAGTAMMVLFIAPFLVILVYRLWTRGTAREPLGIDSSARFQRMEQSIELIAMEVERIAEGQRFTTRILAERHPDSMPRAQATPAQGSDATSAH
jgi:hypothetical protein